MRGCLTAHRLPASRTFRRTSKLPGAARARGCALLPAPAAERRGAGGPLRRGGRERHAVARGCQAGGSQAAFATRTEKGRWPDGAGAGSQGGVQWPGTLSTMAVASRARELLGLALLSAAAVRGRARGAGAIHVSVLVSSSRTYAHRMCSLARAKTKPLTTGGQT